MISVTSRYFLSNHSDAQKPEQIQAETKERKRHFTFCCGCVSYHLQFHLLPGNPQAVPQRFLLGDGCSCPLSAVLSGSLPLCPPRPPSLLPWSLFISCSSRRDQSSKLGASLMGNDDRRRFTSGYEILRARMCLCMRVCKFLCTTYIIQLTYNHKTFITQ